MVSRPVIDLDNFIRRTLQDALAEATRSYWLRRAADFEAAKPIEPPGGFRNPEAAREQWRRCHAAATACRNAAELAPLQDYTSVVESVLGEVA